MKKKERMKRKEKLRCRTSCTAAPNRLANRKHCALSTQPNTVPIYGEKFVRLRHIASNSQKSWEYLFREAKNRETKLTILVLLAFDQLPDEGSFQSKFIRVLFSFCKLASLFFFRVCFFFPYAGIEALSIGYRLRWRSDIWRYMVWTIQDQ